MLVHDDFLASLREALAKSANSPTMALSQQSGRRPRQHRGKLQAQEPIPTMEVQRSCAQGSSEGLMGSAKYRHSSNVKRSTESDETRAAEKKLREASHHRSTAHSPRPKGKNHRDRARSYSRVHKSIRGQGKPDQTTMKAREDYAREEMRSQHKNRHRQAPYRLKVQPDAYQDRSRHGKNLYRVQREAPFQWQKHMPKR